MAAERRCGTCHHWRHRSQQWGDCRPTLPWWHDPMHDSWYITGRCEGEGCAAFVPREESDDG